MTTSQRHPGGPSATAELSRLADSYWTFLLERDPLLRSRRGMPVKWLPDVSVAQTEDRARFATGILDQVRALHPTGLSGDDADTLGYLTELAERDIGAARFYWLTPCATPYQLLPLSLYADTVFRPFVLDGPADAERYASLVHGLARHVGSLAEKVAGQAARGCRIPARALEGVRTTLRGLRASVVAAVVLDEARLVALDRAHHGRLEDEVSRLVAAELEPAFDQLLGAVDDRAYRGDPPERVGWAHYDGGEEAYRFFVRAHTTTDMSPERLHDLGREHCRELAERMREIRAVMGFTGSETEFHARLKTEPVLYARTPEEVEARYRHHLNRLEPLLPRWFAALPRAPYDVARLDPALEPRMTFGYYDGPTAVRPVGRYRYNASDLANRSLLSAANLIYHELVPGHHFQLARQAENASLPDLRRELTGCSGFLEGWAEYAAGLGWEMGLYDDPWDAYGRLAGERFTAARMVVDTGLNLGTMNLEQATEYLRAHSMESEARITTELLRYATDLPGQALAYRTGYIEFQALRSAAEQREGARFDVRAFHETVLSGGALPLADLRRRVARHSARRFGAPAPEASGQSS
ncbi:DUF885 family protein [Streptomyces sp. NBC_01481]|uniref:DUF885 domain-containing protein n=1 Tax=Streptomyces sp. NBC_01481 TaxID=2975869 RepID=UPI0022566DDF|nr:DUF885 domain-containing protein [Streptomyces sp. NBC_01481]MCX4587268.1 DUF885 domain-containing protein [Streptomyces sp. NBC_01481]